MLILRPLALYKGLAFIGHIRDIKHTTVLYTLVVFNRKLK